MIIIKHRVNSSKELKRLNNDYGVEIDLRSNNKTIYLHHDPYVKGELFSKWIKHYDHKLLVLNVKEEGLERQILKILKKNKIRNFFFHDQTFSTILKNMYHTNVSIRFSEYEGLKKMNMLFNKIKWLWVDNFTKIHLEKKFFLFLKKQNVKICIVSPELVKKERIKEINNIILKLRKNNLKIDAVCTKQPKLWLKYY